MYISNTIYLQKGKVVCAKSARRRHHYRRRAASLRFVLCTLPAWIKIPDKGIEETEMDLQSVLRKVANFYGEISYRRCSRI